MTATRRARSKSRVETQGFFVDGNEARLTPWSYSFCTRRGYDVAFRVRCGKYVFYYCYYYYFPFVFFFLLEFRSSRGCVLYASHDVGRHTEKRVYDGQSNAFIVTHQIRFNRNLETYVVCLGQKLHVVLHTHSCCVHRRVLHGRCNFRINRTKKKKKIQRSFV